MPPFTKKLKVVRTRRIKLDKKIPVYDVTVKNTHNFVLGNGAVVHNSHIQGVYDAIYQAFRQVSKKNDKWTANELKNGIMGFVNYFLSDPEFSSQTKEKLVSKNAQKDVKDRLVDDLTNFLKKNKSTARSILNRANNLKKANEEAKKTRKEALKIKTNKKNPSLPGILSTASKDTPPEKKELYILEGGSAGGTASDARDPKFQEILELSGKVINASKNSLSRVLSSKPVQNMLMAIGTRPEEITKQNGDPSFRVGKIIILCFDGATKVMLLDGRKLTLRDMYKEYKKYKKEFWVYGVNEEGDVVPVKATPSKTVKRSEYAKVTFSNGYKIKCTLDHKFMVNLEDLEDNRLIWKNNNPYVKAEDLEEGDSLKSAYLTELDYGNGYYPYLLKNKGGTNYSNNQYIHNFVAECCGIGKNKNQVYHHKDEDRYNNVPSNIKVKSRSNHSKLHALKEKTFVSYNHSDKHKFRVKELHSCGYYREKGVYDSIIDYNNSGKHKDVVSELWNEGRYDTERQIIGKYAKFYLGIKRLGLKVNKANWESLMTENKVFLRWDKEKVRKAKKYINEKGLEKSKGYNLIKKKKTSYPTQGITKFVNMCKTVLEKEGELSEKVYTEYRRDMIQRGLIANGTPTWEYGIKNIGAKNVDEVVEYVDSYNHKVKNVKVIRSKKPKQMYCLNCESTGNFAIYAGDSEVKTRKKNNKREYHTYDCEGMIFVSNSDADQDGFHIANLVLTDLFYLVPKVFENGMVYVVDAPLYFCNYKNKKHYGYSLEEIQNKVGTKANITRAKGWGEAPYELLQETAFDPKTRKLFKVLPVEGEEKFEFHKVVGEDTSYRKELLGIN